MLHSSREHTQNKKCPDCHGLGYVLVDNWTARECPCLERERLRERFRNSHIPIELEHADFQNYQVKNRAQRILYQAAKQYLNQFFDGQTTRGLGFLATVGEQTLRKIQDGKKKRQIKERHNNMGIGKSHLQIAIAKKLMWQGVAVLVISDVALMDELMLNRANNDQAYQQKIHQVANIPVLVWDDLGKSNPSEAKRSAYFRIIDERYRKQKPILFSTNEDVETLADRIGDATSSRLLGMSSLYAVEGPDYRILGQK